MKTRSIGLLATSVIGAMVALADQAQAAELVQCAAQERCYGVSRSGKNDCATASSACSGTSRHDFQKDAWVYVPKGTCLKLAGGSLSAPSPQKTK